MTLEQLCTNRELSMRMRELGYPQESLFWWDIPSGWSKEKEALIKPDEYFERPRIVMLDSLWNVEQNPKRWIAAPTASEIGEMLPRTLKMKVWNLPHTKQNEEVVYLTQTGRECYYADDVQGGKADTEADARAALWIYLKENNLI